MDALAIIGTVILLAILLLGGCCGPYLLIRRLTQGRGSNIQDLDYREVNMTEKTIRLKISGMTCQGCAQTISRYLKKEDGVLGVAIQWQKGTGEVTFDLEATSEEEILASPAFQGVYSARVKK